MARESLLEYFQPDSRPSGEIALVWKRGYRTVRWNYAELLSAATQFAIDFQTRGIAKGDRVMLWGENSGEWVAAFLGCLFTGAIAVPMDAISEKSFVQRVIRQAKVRLVVADRGLPALEAASTLWFEQMAQAAPAVWAGDTRRFAGAKQDDVVQIVFTSGTTAEPRGVAITHANILANLEPVAKEIGRYRRYERIFHPLRFLDLLPLSHVFGQLLGIFIPQILGATSVFLNTLNPAEVIRTIRDEKVSLLVTVPRLLESLGDQIERDIASAGQLEKFRRDFESAKGEHFLRRWWRFRAIHRRFGWRFWAAVSGGATLPEKTETFFSRIGYAVIQGYGLTETTSLISLNHPFRLGRGSIGKALPGREVKLGDGGEILVRGAGVASGYWKDSGVDSVLDADGWFHTGDIGERDAAGQLFFKGRSKNVLVTAEGLNIYPQDLETELRKEAGVRDCVVVGLDRDGNAEPCAALLLRGFSGRAENHAQQSVNAEAEEAVRRTNERLAPFQQIRHWFIWPGQDFPRTPTQKPVLSRIRETAEIHFGMRAEAQAAEGAKRSPLADVLSRVSKRSRDGADGNAPLDLSSIERVEMLALLEDRYQMDLSETEFSRVNTVEGLQRLLEQPAQPALAFHYPRWAQSWPVRAVRALLFNLLARPAIYALGWPRVKGSKTLRSVDDPLLVIANHVTFFDPAYVLMGLPPRLRRRLAVAMDGERLESMRHPPVNRGLFRAFTDRASYWLLITVFNVFPLPRNAGFRKSFQFAGDLMDRGWSVLVFPEGAETVDGKMAPFRAGIGLLAQDLGVPVVPLYLDGLTGLKMARKRWARPGRIKVLVGVPEKFAEGLTPEEIAGRLEKAVAALSDAEK